jgi:hypothetical protein
MQSAFDHSGMWPSCKGASLAENAGIGSQQLLNVWKLSAESQRILYERPLRKHPPPCRRLTSDQCPTNSTRACVCHASSGFYKESAAGHTPEESAVAHTPELDLKSLRVYFLDGHTGPMNDMLAFLHDALGIPAQNFDGIVFLQGMLMRSQIDPRFMKAHRGKMLGWNMTKSINQYLTESNSGRSFTLPKCEQKGCRRSAYDDTLRREFASKFGATIEANVDVVACNFPTWQCSLFMYVRVAVAMRYTHRWDHHLQGVPLTKVFQKPQLLAAREGPRPASAAEEAGFVLRQLYSRPNVLLAASNPYAGLSVQLSHISYTGERPKALFCCGSSAYSRAIGHMASVIRNTSREQALVQHAVSLRA